ncbi:hypothetical protein FOZ63_025397, partial [Perkinsus olseni]
MLSMRGAVDSLENDRARREARIDALSSSLAALSSQVGEQETKLGELVVETKRELTEVRRTATSLGPEFEKKLAAVLQRNVEKMRAPGVAGQGDKRVTLLEGKMAKVMDQLDLFDAIFERDGRKLDELWGNRGCEDVIAMIEESLVQDRQKLAELWHRYTEEDGWEEGIERRVGRLEADERELIDKMRAVDGVAGVSEELRALRDDLRAVTGEVGELRVRAEAAERRLDEVMRSMENFDRKTREVDGTGSVEKIERSEAGSQKPDSDSSDARGVVLVLGGTGEDASAAVSGESQRLVQEISREAAQGEPVDEGPEGTTEGSPSATSPETPAVPRWSKGDELSGLSSDLDIPRTFNATDDVECSAGPDLSSSQAPTLSVPVVGSHREEDDGVAESAGSDASHVKSKIIVELGTTEAAEEARAWKIPRIRPCTCQSAPIVQGSESGDEGRPWSPRAEVQLASSHLVLAAQRELDVTVGSDSEVGSIPEDFPSPPPSDTDDDGRPDSTGAETRPTGVIAVDDIVKKNASYDDWDDDEEESAGLDACPGQPMNPLAVKLLHSQGYDTTPERNHRSKQLTMKMLCRARVVYGMDRGHVERLEGMVDEKVDGMKPRVMMLVKESIPDPYTYSEEAWPPIMDMLQRGVEARLREHLHGPVVLRRTARYACPQNEQRITSVESFLCPEFPMRVDPLFTTPTLVSASNINENLMGSRRAVRGKEDQESTTIQLIQPSANCAYLTTFEAGHTSAKQVASLQLGGQKLSLEPRVNTSDNVIQLCYFDSESKEVRVASLSTEDGRIDDSARCKVDESVRCIEWLSSNSIIVLCKDTVLELTADPLEILRSAHIDVPRHSHTCRIRSREGVDELLVYGTGGLSVFSPSVNGIRCARRFLCSGRVTAAAQLEEGIIVCRIEAHEQGDGSGGRSMNSLGQGALLDRLMMPDGSALPALPLDSSKEFAVTLPTTV